MQSDKISNTIPLTTRGNDIMTAPSRGGIVSTLTSGNQAVNLSRV